MSQILNQANFVVFLNIILPCTFTTEELNLLAYTVCSAQAGALSVCFYILDSPLPPCFNSGALWRRNYQFSQHERASQVHCANAHLKLISLSFAEIRNQPFLFGTAYNCNLRLFQNPANCLAVLLLSLFFFLRCLVVVSFSTVRNCSIWSGQR